MSRIFIIILFALLGSGCDWVNGVSRIASLSNLPEMSCVEAVLQDVPGISDIKHHVESGSRVMTLGGLQDPETIYRYSYKYSSLNGGFYFTVDYNGKVEFHHTYLYMNSIPPQDEIDQIRPVMSLVEQGLETRCNVEFITKPVREFCSKVECV